MVSAPPAARPPPIPDARPACASICPSRPGSTLAARRLKPGGRLTAIQLAERLPDLLAACADRFGSIDILPLAPRAGRPAKRVILRARKGGRGALRLLEPVAIHRGAGHDGDRDSHSAVAQAVLRDGAALGFPNR